MINLGTSAVSNQKAIVDQCKVLNLTDDEGLIYYLRWSRQYGHRLISLLALHLLLIYLL